MSLTIGSSAAGLLDLRYRLSALVADPYAAAGFTTVVQDNPIDQGQDLGNSK